MRSTQGELTVKFAEHSTKGSRQRYKGLWLRPDPMPCPHSYPLTLRRFRADPQTVEIVLVPHSRVGSASSGGFTDPTAPTLAQWEETDQGSGWASTPHLLLGHGCGYSPTSTIIITFPPILHHSPHNINCKNFHFFFFFFWPFLIIGLHPGAYGSSQAIAAGLCHSHSKATTGIPVTS